MKSHISNLAKYIAIVIVAMPTLSAYSQVQGVAAENPFKLSSETASLFNERGYLQASSVFGANDMVNEYSGNLIVAYPLYHFEGKGGLNLDVKLVYNGDVSAHLVKRRSDDHSQGYSVNLPEWIISVNGFAVQTMNFEKRSLPTATDVGLSTEYVGYEGPNPLNEHRFPLLERGYHFSNYLGKIMTPNLNLNGRARYGTRDCLVFMTEDGGQINLFNQSDRDNLDALTGDYRPAEPNSDWIAKVERISTPSPYYNNLDFRRRVTLKKSDGTTYIFEEDKPPFSPYLSHLHLLEGARVVNCKNPRPFYLKKIYKHNPKICINLYYTWVNQGSGNIIQGRKLISRIHIQDEDTEARKMTNEVNRNDMVISFDWQFMLDRIAGIQLTSGDSKDYLIGITSGWDWPSTQMASNDKSRASISFLRNKNGEEVNFRFEPYKRIYENINLNSRNPIQRTKGEFIFSRLKTIYKIAKNSDTLSKVEYQYIDTPTHTFGGISSLSMNYSQDHLQNKIHASGDFSVIGRDKFFSNIVTKRSVFEGSSKLEHYETFEYGAHAPVLPRYDLDMDEMIQVDTTAQLFTKRTNYAPSGNEYERTEYDYKMFRTKSRTISGLRNQDARWLNRVIQIRQYKKSVSDTEPVLIKSEELKYDERSQMIDLIEKVEKIDSAQRTWKHAYNYTGGSVDYIGDRYLIWKKNSTPLGMITWEDYQFFTPSIDHPEFFRQAFITNLPVSECVYERPNSVNILLSKQTKNYYTTDAIEWTGNQIDTSPIESENGYKGQLRHSVIYAVKNGIAGDSLVSTFNYYRRTPPGNAFVTSDIDCENFPLNFYNHYVDEVRNGFGNLKSQSSQIKNFKRTKALRYTPFWRYEVLNPRLGCGPAPLEENIPATRVIRPYGHFLMTGFDDTLTVPMYFSDASRYTRLTLSPLPGDTLRQYRSFLANGKVKTLNKAVSANNHYTLVEFDKFSDRVKYITSPLDFSQSFINRLRAERQQQNPVNRDYYLSLTAGMTIQNTLPWPPPTGCGTACNNYASNSPEAIAQRITPQIARGGFLARLCTNENGLLKCREKPYHGTSSIRVAIPALNLVGVRNQYFEGTNIRQIDTSMFDAKFTFTPTHHMPNRNVFIRVSKRSRVGSSTVDTVYSDLTFSSFQLNVERELNLSFPLQRAFLLPNSTTDTLFIDFWATDFNPANGGVVMSPPAHGPHDTTIISVFKMLSSTGIEITRKNQFGDGRAHGFTRRIEYDDGLKQATIYDKSHNLTDDAQMNSKGVENADGLFRPIESQSFNNFFNGELPIGATSSSSSYKTYNHKSQTTASTDARGFTTRFTYDRYDNLARTRHPDQTSTFDTTFYLGSPSALATSPLFGLNLVYQKRAYPYALPCTTWFMVKVSSDETGRKTLGIYDAGERQIRTVIDPEGLRIITDYQYDGLNRLTQITQPNGNTIDYGYDGWGNRDYERTAETGETFMKYNAFGELRFKRTARQSQFRVGAGFLGQFSFYRYDHIGRLVVEGTVNTGEGQLAQTWNSLDPNKDEWFENEATDFAVHRKLFYDRAPSTSNTANTAIGNGNSATFNWSNSGISETEMTNLKGNLAAEAYREENGGWQYKYYSYDERDRVKWLRAKTHRVGATPQVETTAYEYDAQNRPIAVHTFSSVATNGISHFYTYDARGRRSDYKVELEAEPAGSQRTIAQYGYDANSNLTALKLGLNAPGDTTLRTEFVYDGRNRLTRKQSFNKFGTRVSECVYSYFANSNLASRGEFHLPMQGETTTWEATFKHSYDGANRLTGQWQEVSEPLDTMVLYEPIAPEVRAKHRLRLKAGFDTRTVTGTGASGTGVKFRGRISANAYAPPLVLAEGYLAMDYDDFGRIMRLLRYDGKGRAIDSLTYQYLNNTGRLGHVRDGVGSEVSGNDVDNQMPNNYAYDASGNLVSDVQSGKSGMRYNADNRLLGFVRNGQNWQYRYDGSGKRVEKVEPNGSVLSYRRGAEGELLATYKNSGEVEKFFVGEEGEGIVSGGNEVNWRYYIRDVVGNVVGVVDRQGNVVGRSRYDAWGYEDSPRGNDGSQFERKFLGLQRDTESEWYHAGVRQYDARLGMFMQTEPLYEVYHEISPYSYARNSPLVMHDASGMSSDSVGKQGSWAEEVVVVAERVVNVFGDMLASLNQRMQMEGVKTGYPGEVIEQLFEWLDSQTRVDGVTIGTPPIVGKGGGSARTQWGWRGTKAWKNMVSRVKEGGTIKDFSGKVPTKSEAIQLLKEAKCKIDRIDGPHSAPNPHNYNHINYTTPSGTKGTIQIQEL